MSLLVEKLHTVEKTDNRKTRFLVMDFKNVLNMGNDNTCMKTKHPTLKKNLQCVKCENNRKS